VRSLTTDIEVQQAISTLVFDASKSDHRFTIEWGPCEILWFVDNLLVHRRAEWEPTPIPHLPMALHVNAWLSRSKELAGRLTNRRLPATSFIRSIALNANLVDGNSISEA
jgi:hypothetical protein